MFRNTAVYYQESPWVYGRYCVPYADIGPETAAKLLKSNGKIVIISTFRALTKTEPNVLEGNSKTAAFDASIKYKLADEAKYEYYRDEPDYDTPFFDLYEDSLSSEAKRLLEYDNSYVEEYDPYVNSKLLLFHKDTQLCGVVKVWKQEQDGTLHGKANAKPILDICVYDVSFPDRTEKEYSDNIIADNIWEQADSEENKYILLDLIIDHKESSDTMKEQGAYVTT